MNEKDRILFNSNSDNYPKNSSLCKKNILPVSYECSFFVFLRSNSFGMNEPTLEQKVVSIIDQIRPYLQGDGGDIEFIELTADNVVRVRLQGACGTCPHAKMTLKNGVEQTLKTHLPEIDRVEDVVLGF